MPGSQDSEVRTILYPSLLQRPSALRSSEHVCACLSCGRRNTLHLRYRLQRRPIPRSLQTRTLLPTTFGVGAETGAHDRVEGIDLALALQHGDVARGELAVAAEAVGFVAGAGGWRCAGARPRRGCRRGVWLFSSASSPGAFGVWRPHGELAAGAAPTRIWGKGPRLEPLLQGCGAVAVPRRGRSSRTMRSPALRC